MSIYAPEFRSANKLLIHQLQKVILGLGGRLELLQIVLACGYTGKRCHRNDHAAGAVEDLVNWRSAAKHPSDARRAMLLQSIPALQ